jgi:hypothetical protein
MNRLHITLHGDEAREEAQPRRAAHRRGMSEFDAIFAEAPS